MVPPEMRSPTIWQDGRAVSQSILSSNERDTSPLDFQASRLQRVYFFCHATARTVATLAYGVAR